MCWRRCWVLGAQVWVIAGGRELERHAGLGLPACAGRSIHLGHVLAHDQARGRLFPTTAIGLFGLVSGVLSLLCHVALEPAGAAAARLALLAVLGLGPLGASFFMWDKALKLGDARHIGILSYIRWRPQRC